MIDLLNKEIIKPEYGLCNSKNFMKTFKKHSESEELIFGFPLADSEPEEIVQINRTFEIQDGSFCFSQVDEEGRARAQKVVVKN